MYTLKWNKCIFIEIFNGNTKYNSEYEAVKGIKSCIWNIEHLEAKKSFLGGKITLLEKDYTKLVGLAKQGVYNADKIWDLEREIKELKEQGQAMFDILSKRNLIPESTEQLHCMRESQKISNRVLKKSMNFDMER